MTVLTESPHITRKSKELLGSIVGGVLVKRVMSTISCPCCPSCVGAGGEAMAGGGGAGRLGGQSWASLVSLRAAFILNDLKL